MATALRVLHTGYPTRASFRDLYDRCVVVKAPDSSSYVSYLPAELADLSPPNFCTAVLMALGLKDGTDFQIGLTKVCDIDTFLRPEGLHAKRANGPAG